MKKYIILILTIALFSIFSTAIFAQPNKGNRRGNGSSNNAPTKPCNQLTGDDLLVKGRKCTLANGQITTVGAYQKSQNQTDGNGQNRGRNQMGGLADAKSPRGNRQGNRRANQTANGGNQIVDDEELLDAKPNSPKNNSVVTLPEGTDMAQSNVQRKPRRGNGRNAPMNTNGEANPPNRDTSDSNSQGKTGAPNLQETRYDFIYPTKPEDIVTWNENAGSYGTTTTNSGWEFILTSDAGIAVRRRGQEGTVVAHTKCNDTANYTFGYGGNSGSIDMIMCRPLRDGLPRLQPSIMIVPKSQQ